MVEKIPPLLFGSDDEEQANNNKPAMRNLVIAVCLFGFALMIDAIIQGLSIFQFSKTLILVFLIIKFIVGAGLIYLILNIWIEVNKE